MKLIITFRDTDARSIEYNLRRKYHSKAKLPALAKLAILKESASQAKIDLLAAEIRR